MPEIPEHLRRRSAEAKAKALGVPVEEVIGEMMGTAPESPAPESPAPESTAPAPPEGTGPAASEATGPTASDSTGPAAGLAEDLATGSTVAGEAVVDRQPEPPPAGANGGGATSVSPRPVAEPEELPEGVRPQRLLTVVKARAIQQVKATPTDKVNTWPHLMIAEFTALLVMTALLIVMSVILQAPLLDLANFNATPNPSKAPWYFLGLQELLSYYDPQIAGVMIPGVVGLVGFMAIPYIDRNPSISPADRKFAIMLFTFFLAGSATLTMLGTLFRGPGFNFTYPWADGIWFDDLKDWVNFE